MEVRNQDQAIEILKGKLEEIYDPNQIIDFMNEDEKMSEQLDILIQESASEQGYPVDYPASEIEHEVMISRNLLSWSDWAKKSIDYLYGIDDRDIEQFFSEKSYLNLFTDNLDQFIFFVDFKESVHEVLQEHPDASYIATLLESSGVFEDEDTLQQIKEERGSDFLDEKVQEQMVDMGFPRDTPVKAIRYDILFRSGIDYVSWAEFILQDDILDQYDSLLEFINRGLQRYVVKNAGIEDIKILIRSEPEDF